MKKFYLFIIAILAVCLFAFIPQNVKADDATVATVDGASIRTVDPMGLRFAGQVTGEFTGTTIKYGFLLSKGSYTKEQMITLYGTSKAIAREAGETLDVEGKFYLSVVNIPSSGYDQNITALAYVDVDGEKTYAASSCTRNITYVANQLADNDDYKDLDFVKKINNSSTFVFNGGEFVKDSSITIGAYNAGSDGTSGITLCSSDERASGSGYYWYKILLKRVAENSHIFEVYNTYDSGTNVAEGAGEYDYVIAGYEGNNANYKAVKAAANYTYFYISTFSAGTIVTLSNNLDLLLNGKLLLEDGDTLPNAKKDYYTFDGWYDNVGLTGDVITEKDGDDAETFYAKYTPIDYTLSYELQDGACSADTSDVLFNVESAEITLPAAGTMSRFGYKFLGWNTNSDGTGATMTSISAGSHSNITVFAIWESIVVELSDADTRVFGLTTPTKFVKSTFADGDFVINGNEYTAGDELFTSVSAAVASASANDIIYVFAGTYTNDSPTVSVSGLSIIGPNYNISANSASPTRSSEASFAGSSIISLSSTAKSFSLNGVKLTGNSYVNIVSAATNANILYVYSNSAGMTTKGSGGNRLATIYAAAGCTGLTVQNCYFNVGSSTYCRDAITLYGTAQDITITNNYITNNASSPSTAEAIQFGTASGTINIKDNTILYPTSNCVLYMSTSNATINIINNFIGGKSSSNSSATIRVANGASGGVVNVIGNDFTYLDVNTFSVGGTVAGHTLNIKYNYFNGKTFQINSPGSGQINYVSNYYTEVQTTATPDVDSISSLSDLITAYKGSADYLTYGSKCVYEN